MGPAAAACSARMSGDERKLSILMASLPLFAKKGFEGTTTKEIAEAAGISEALMYRHFKGKEELYVEIQALICSQKDNIMRQFEAMPLSCDTLALLVFFNIQVVNEAFEGDLIRESIPRLFLMSLLEDGRFVQTFYQAKFECLIPIIEKQLQYCKREGVLNATSNLNAKEVLFFTHHVATGIRFGRLPGDIYDYGVDQKDCLRDAFRFAIRGIGFREDYLQKLNHDALLERYEGMFSA